MSITTTFGPGTPTVRVVSIADSMNLAYGDYITLFNSGPIAITGSGNNVLLQGSIFTSNDSQCQFNVLIDNEVIYTGGTGVTFSLPVAMSEGVHGIDYNVVALNYGISLMTAGFTLIDLGI